MSWLKNNTTLREKEVSAARKRFPDINIAEEREKLIFEGMFPVLDKSRAILQKYALKIIFPHNYPLWIPDVFMLDSRVPKIADRHIEMGGRGCLCLPHDVLGYFQGSITFNNYFDRLLNPWLIGQVGFDKMGKWPWPARSHRKEGILEGLAEILNLSDLNAVERYAKILVTKEPAKGHTLCPCGSGEKLRNCHSAFYRKAWDSLPVQAKDFYRKFI